MADKLIKSFSDDTRQTPNFRARRDQRGKQLFTVLSRHDTTPPDNSESANENVSHAHNTPEYQDTLERIERRLDEISSLLRSRPSNG